jgi:hypothetical protein
MNNIYDILKGKVIDAGELVSMMEAQTDGECKLVKEFNERIIDLIVSHAYKIPTKPVDVFNIDVLNTDAPIKDKLTVLMEKQKMIEQEMKNYENSIVGKTVRVAFRNDIETAKIKRVDYKAGKLIVVILDIHDEEYEADETGLPIVEYDFNEILG